MPDHLRQLAPVATDIDDLVGNDEMVLGIDGRLNVVAHQSPTGTGCHGAGIRIGELDLPSRRLIQLSLNFLELLHPGLQRCHLLLEPSSSSFGNLGWLAICGIHFRQIALDAPVDFLHPLFEFAPREVAIVGIDRFELATINGHDSLGKEIQLAAQHDKLTTGVADAFAVVPPEVCNPEIAARAATSIRHSVAPPALAGGLIECD